MSSHLTAIAPSGPGSGSTEITPASTMHETALAVLRAQHAAALANEAGSRDGDVEAVHDMRVAVRRMRAALSAFEDALPARAAGLRRELGWLGRALGEVRDQDVHLEQIAVWNLTAPESERPGLTLVERSLAARRVSARARMIRALGSERRRRLDAAIEDLLHAAQPRRPVARAYAVDVAPGIVIARYRKMRSLGDTVGDDSPAEALHRLRIRCKRLRYILEFLTPLYGKPARSFARRIVRVQDLLGAHQDAVISEQMLLAIAESASPGVREAFAIGRLAERHAHIAAEAREGFADAYRPLTRRRWRALRAAMDDLRTESASAPETTS